MDDYQFGYIKIEKKNKPSKKSGLEKITSHNHWTL
jgi:hypothetical protein